MEKVARCRRRECGNKATHLVRKYENLNGHTVGSYCKAHALDKLDDLLNEYDTVAVKNRVDT